MGYRDRKPISLSKLSRIEIEDMIIHDMIETYREMFGDVTLDTRIAIYRRVRQAHKYPTPGRVLEVLEAMGWPM